MKQRKVLSALLLTTSATLAGVGCTQYNGAVADPPAGITAAPSRGASGVAGNSGNVRTGLPNTNTNNAAVQVQFDTPDPMNANRADRTSSMEANGTIPAVNAQLVGQRPDRSIQPFFLYGQIAQSVPSQSSPMDSSDNLRQATFASEGADFDPAIDPVGGRIAFASTRHRQTSDIYLQKIGGTAVTQLTNDPANDAMPAFSPDGKKVAFASDRSGTWAIYLVDANGGPAQQLTNDATQDIHPSFSPDGKQIVYCSYGAQSGQWELVVIDVENPANKRFVGYGLFPSWSPVGNKIVFQKARERGTRWFGIWTIEYVNGEGLRPTQIAASSNAAAINPHWSPDGRQIVFSTVLNPDGTPSLPTRSGEQPALAAKPVQADIWVTNADGSGRVNLTRSRFVNVQPTWGADGAIYFVSNRAKDGIENIWAIQPEKLLPAPAAGSVANMNGASSEPKATPHDSASAGTTAQVPTP